MKSIKKRVKQSKFLGSTLNTGGKVFFQLLDKIYSKKENIILFTSFTGRQFSDSPRALYEYFKDNDLFSNYRFVWAFRNPDVFPNDLDKVKISSFAFLKILMSSKVWISNASIERLIPYKPEETIYINTWHGIPLKYIGTDALDCDPMVGNWYENVRFDLLTACSNYDKAILQHVFPSTENIVLTGLPRNEVLVNHKMNKYKKSNQYRYVVLYAPTFRENTTSFSNAFSEANLSKLSDVLFLIRGHYFSDVHLSGKNIIDVSGEDINDVMECADILVTDYSSIMFDYALLNKPILLYPYDLNQYIKERGMYLDYRSLGLSMILSFEDLEKYLSSLDVHYKDEVKKTEQLCHRFQKNNNSLEYISNYLGEYL